MRRFSFATLLGFRICKFPLSYDSASDLFLEFALLNLGFAGCHARQLRGFRVSSNSGMAASHSTRVLGLGLATACLR